MSWTCCSSRATPTPRRPWSWSTPTRRTSAAIVGALLGLEFEGEPAEAPPEARQDHHAFGFSQDDIQQMAAGLGPGEAAGLLLIEHVWARDLRKVFRGAGGRIIGEGFLTPEAIRAVEPAARRHLRRDRGSGARRLIAAAPDPVVVLIRKWAAVPARRCPSARVTRRPT